MRYLLSIAGICFAVSCTTTQFGGIPPLTPSVSLVGNEFMLHVSVHNIEPDAVGLVFDATYRTTDLNGSLEEQTPISGSCIDLEGKPFPCDEAGKPITGPCEFHIKMWPLKPDANSEWSADLRMSPDSGVCTCVKNHCRGKLVMFLWDQVSGKPLPGPHTAVTLKWHESENQPELIWKN